MTRTVCYLDHSSTTYPRSGSVADAMTAALNQAASPDRGGYGLASEAERLLEQCRKAVARRFGMQDPNRVVFTSGCTDSINQVLHGLLRPSDRVVACTADHNAVIRPLHALAQAGVQVRLVTAGRFALLDPDSLAAALAESPARLLILTHASNVTGAVLDLRACLQAARQAGVPVLLDAAQSAGHASLALDELEVAATAIPGHKALGGPPGVGLLCLGRGFEFPPARQGGSGFDSASLEMPGELPARYEAGTPNVPGIAGLLAALREETVAVTQAGELRNKAWAALSNSPGVTLYGPGPKDTSVPVLSFNVAGLPPQLVAACLAEEGVCVRAGLHCAPGAHRAIGTFDEGGTVRASFGLTNTEADVARLVKAVERLTESLSPVRMAEMVKAGK